MSIFHCVYMTLWVGLIVYNYSLYLVFSCIYVIFFCICMSDCYHVCAFCVEFCARKHVCA